MEIPDLGSSLPAVALRTAIVYAFLVIALRLAGKREVGQLSILDLIVLLLIADALQNAMVGDNITLVGGLVAGGTLVALDWILNRTTARSPRIRRVLQGEPRMLVRDGVVLEHALEEEGLTRDELDAVVRSHGLISVGQVALAILETNGAISVIPSPTPSDAAPGSPTASG